MDLEEDPYMHKIHQKLPLHELRQVWAHEWCQQPHARIGRTILERSLEFKIRQNEGRGLTPEQQERLNDLVRQYKRDPACFDNHSPLKPGTRLVRMHGGKKHIVLVRANGFEYEGITYASLSKIAHDITSKRWNGWVFFGLKKVGGK